jgi:hypothetical protein
MVRAADERAGTDSNSRSKADSQRDSDRLLRQTVGLHGVDLATTGLIGIRCEELRDRNASQRVGVIRTRRARRRAKYRSSIGGLSLRADPKGPAGAISARLYAPCKPPKPKLPVVL